MIGNNRITPLNRRRFFLALPDQHIIGALKGVVSASLSIKFNDIWEIDFEIDKHMNGQPNPLFDRLIPLMEILVEGLGWFRITQPPNEIAEDNGRIYKRFTAFGEESVLQEINLSMLYINAGTEASMEMFEENLNELGIPKQNIKLYLPNANEDSSSDHYYKLGLLNILERNYLAKRGWSIGEIPASLAALRGRKFEIDSSNLYAFLTQDAAKAFRCVFFFNRNTRKISAYPIESVGKSLNIEFSRRNVINQADIDYSNTNDELITRFRVSGKNTEQTIFEYINFGSPYLDNINYFLDSGILAEETAAKYRNYEKVKESKRQSYLDIIKQRMQNNEKITSIREQMPVHEVDTLWKNLTDEELDMEIQHFQAVLDTLKEMYTSQGVLSIQESPDYSLYLSVKEIILPDLLAEKEKRNQGAADDAPRVDYKTNWQLYGTNELTSLKKGYEAQLEILIQSGYDKEWPDFNKDQQGSRPINQDAWLKQHELYLTYQGYVHAIQIRLDQLEQRIRELENSNTDLAVRQKSCADEVSMENPIFAFNDKELSLIRHLFTEADYVDDNIEILDTDTIDDIIQHAWDLLESAREQLDIESHPQLTYSIDMDNPYFIRQFKDKMNSFQIGDFIFMELENGFKTKQRAIELSNIELTDPSSSRFNIKFSDMVTCYGMASDYRFLLNSRKSSSKNRISKDVESYITTTFSSLASQLFSKYLTGNSGGGIFANGISQGDLQKLQDALDGLIGGAMTLDEFKGKLALIENLEADSAFVKYLEAQFLVGNQAEFISLKSTLALIDNLLTGTVSAELGHIIHLTAENVSIDEAVIRKLIAAQITVSMLKAGDITLDNNMKILSENGLMIMDGQTLQVMGTHTNGEHYVAIQLGYDAKNNPSLIIRDTNGTVLLDGSGLHDGMIPDGLIKNDMIAKETISKDKLSFKTVDTDANGNINASCVMINGHGIDTEFTTISETIDKIEDGSKHLAETLSGVSSKVNAVDKSITDKIWQSDMITVKDKNGTDVQKSIKDALVQSTTDISGINTSVSKVQTDVANKADGSTVTNLSKQVADMKLTSDAFKVEVSETYATKDNASELENQITSVQSAFEQTAASISSQVEDAYGQITEIIQTADEINSRVGSSEEALSFLANTALPDLEKDVKNTAAQMTIHTDSINSKIALLEGNITSLSEITQDVNGLKLKFAEIGMYSGDDIEHVKTITYISKDGIRVSNRDPANPGIRIAGNTTLINDTAFSGYVNDGTQEGDGIKMFELTKERVYTNRLVADNGLDLINMKILPVTYNEGAANELKTINFIKASGNS